MIEELLLSGAALFIPAWCLWAACYQKADSCDA